MNIEDTPEYYEALHFVQENSPEVVARQMARDMIRIRHAQEIASEMKETILNAQDIITRRGY